MQAKWTQILVRGANWLGDAVMSTPALLRLREAHPDAMISILTPQKLADLWRHHPAIDSVLTFAPEEGAWPVARQLRRGNFELGVVLPNSFLSALELWLARVPQRIGYGGQWRSGLLTRAVATRHGAVRMRKRSVREVRRLIQSNTPAADASFGDLAHHIQQYLHLMSFVGASPEPLAPRLVVTESEVETFLQRYEIKPAPAQPLFGLNPGAEYGAAKRWPAERFVSAAVEIGNRTNCRWVIFGGKADLELAARMVGQIERALEQKSPAALERSRQTHSRGLESSIGSVFNLAGQTSLRGRCAGLQACRVLLTNDTGPMHVAAALGTPVVALFGSTSPALTGPGLPGDPNQQLLRAAVPCSPCFLRECPIDFRCMKSLSVEQVVKAVLERAAGRSR